VPDRWWRDAVVYQIYLRSFADGDGDGIGDLTGLRARLQYLAGLGIDAIWVNPWYPSPMVDGGYDVTDYRAIDPVFGTLAEAETLIQDAHRHGLRVLADIVPGSRRPSPAAPARSPASGTSSIPAEATTATCRPTTGAACSAAPPGPA
jgi:alpha-glucosidase